MRPRPVPERMPVLVRTPSDEAHDDEGQGRLHKSSAAFRTISEVADELDVAQHVLRFWESKFPQVRPLKRGGGRRYYRPEDVEILRQIRSLLYEEGYTIKGAQKLLRSRRGGRAGAEKLDSPPGPSMPPRPVAGPAPTPPDLVLDRQRRLRGLRAELVEIRSLLARLRAELS